MEGKTEPTNEYLVRRRVCLHEAGHIAVALALGLEVVDARAGTEEGHANVEMAKIMTKNELQMLAGGYVSEQLFFGCRLAWDDHLRHDWLSDFTGNSGHDGFNEGVRAMGLTPEEAGEVVKETAEILITHRGQVDQISELLRLKGYASGDELRRIWAGATAADVVFDALAAGITAKVLAVLGDKSHE